MREETLMERETIGRWNESSELAYLWTASADPATLATAGLHAIQDEPGGSAVRLPKHLIGFKPVRGPIEPVVERLCLAKTLATERNARGRALRAQPRRVSLVGTFMEPAAHAASPNCPIAIWHVSRTNRLRLSVLPRRSAQPDEGVSMRTRFGQSKRHMTVGDRGRNWPVPARS